MIYELRKQIEYFLRNKIYMVSLIIAAVAGYGYEITHSSLGIDDVCIGLYFDDGLGVSIGRWPFYVINKLFHVTGFEPFIMEFAAVLILMFAAIVWSAVLRYILGDKLPIACYAVFSAMFLDYSLIAEVFIYYLQNGVPIIYTLVGMAVFDLYYLYTHDLEQKQRILHKLGMSLLVSVSVGFYEAAANVFLTGVLLIMIVDCFGANHMRIRKFKQFFMSLFLVGRVLVYAIVERSLITKVCMAIFGIEPYSYRSAGSMLRILKYPGRILTIIRQILRDYVFVGLAYYPIGLFVATSILFIVIIIAGSIYKKNLYILFLGIICYGSIFVLSLPQGDALPYRSNLMIALLVAMVLFYLTYVILKCRYQLINVIGMVLVISVVYNSAFDLNHWFAFEYEKNQSELAVVDQVAYDLQKGGYNIAEKPVVFIGSYELNPAILEKCSMGSDTPGYSVIKDLNDWMGEETGERYVYVQTLSWSLIDWAIPGFYIYEGYNREMIRLFEERGYQLIWGGTELYEKALEQEEQLNEYPLEGYIREYDDYIVVRF